MAEIYLAGGCFWGLEEYFSRIPGVEKTTVGYANGQVETTNYRLIKETDHAETVQVIYDPDKSLPSFFLASCIPHKERLTSISSIIIQEPQIFKDSASKIPSTRC